MKERKEKKKIMLPEKFNDWKKCYFCDECYQQKNNIGFLKCRIHPGIKLLNDSNNILYYSCCGTVIKPINVYYQNQFKQFPIFSEKDKMGCLEIDHFCYDELLEKGIISISKKRIKKDNDDIKSFSSNLNEKIEQIKSLSFMIVPGLLYKNGLFKPIYSNTILQHFDYKDIENIEKYVKENLSSFGTNTFNVNYKLNLESNALQGYFYNKKYFNSSSLINGEVFYLENNTNNIKNNDITIDLLQIIQTLKEEFLSLNNNDNYINNFWQENITSEITENDHQQYNDNNNNINFSFYVISRIGDSLSFNCNEK